MHIFSGTITAPATIITTTTTTPTTTTTTTTTTAQGQVDCELFSFNCGIATADVIVNRTCYETKSYSTFENVYIQINSSLDLSLVFG